MTVRQLDTLVLAPFPCTTGQLGAPLLACLFARIPQGVSHVLGQRAASNRGRLSILGDLNGVELVEVDFHARLHPAQRGDGPVGAIVRQERELLPVCIFDLTPRLAKDPPRSRACCALTYRLGDVLGRRSNDDDIHRGRAQRRPARRRIVKLGRAGKVHLGAGRQTALQRLRLVNVSGAEARDEIANRGQTGAGRRQRPSSHRSDNLHLELCHLDRMKKKGPRQVDSDNVSSRPASTAENEIRCNATRARRRRSVTSCSFQTETVVVFARQTLSFTEAERSSLEGKGQPAKQGLGRDLFTRAE